MVDDFTCKGCGREEAACSADPCAGVIADRGDEPAKPQAWMMLVALEKAERFIEEELQVRRNSFLPVGDPYIDDAEEVLSAIKSALDNPAEIPLDPNHAHLAQALRNLTERLRSLSLDMPASVYSRFREELLDADEALENYKRPTQETGKPQTEGKFPETWKPGRIV
jgi:hypothetical protein